MTYHVPQRQLRFYLTAHAPCPYLPDRWERKVFAHLPMGEGAIVNDALTSSGFRRSQTVAYRPACDACQACMSVRIPVAAYEYSRTEARTLRRNAGLTRHLVEAEATREQFELLRRYLGARHPAGGMSDLSWSDYVSMVEDTTVRTHVMEYRAPSRDGGPGDLVAAALVDVLGDGLSLVYSFFDPGQPRCSLGAFIVLDHVQQARSTGLPFVYLGYWIQNSRKMAYKGRFSPLEVLQGEGWRPVTEAERNSAAGATAPGLDGPANTSPAHAGRIDGGERNGP